MSDNKAQQKAFGGIARAVALASEVGLLLMACVAIGLFLGKWLDGLLGTSPWLLLAFSLLGMVSAFRAVLGLIRRQTGLK